MHAPRAHLAAREAHAVPTYPSGMPPNSLCYYTLNIMAHYRPSNNKEKWCTNDVKICNNDETPVL